MKVFSNFDTQFRQKVITKKLESFPEDKILVINRSRFYLIFRVVFPFFVVWLLGMIIFSFLELYSINWYVSIPIMLVWLLVFWFRVVHKFLKFRYDFTIIDPLGVTTYKQKWILHSFLKEIPSNRIRTIQICRNNILENIFWYGSLDILTDFTDNMHIWEDNEAPSVIGMTYVDRPFQVENQITDLCFK